MASVILASTLYSSENSQAKVTFLRLNLHFSLFRAMFLSLHHSRNCCTCCVCDVSSVS